ncbi:MAG: DUF29 domain-containing protein [Elainella sp. C42_A2020_010]|nr:DUF29 domain-containing protein [Elainella sp. C42_A2020_010]RNJ66173.1 MAG: DUF29 domain-containing protein [Leptolyngbya sp. IPPAS B-1204]
MQIHSQSQPASSLYEQDFYLWLQQMAQLLKIRNFEEVDWDNLIEEIESMGRSEKRELKSRLIVLIEHLLKLIYWEAEKGNNAHGWRSTIIEQRNQIELALEDSPSLGSLLPEIFLDCYKKARQGALRKYQLSNDLFPEEPPFQVEDLLNPNYLPE